MQAINWSWCLWVARPSSMRSAVLQLPHERKTPSTGVAGVAGPEAPAARDALW
jgi:hypothetical protein